MSTLSTPYIRNYGNISESFEYEKLTDNLIAVYCQCDNSYSILSKTAIETKCLKCRKCVKSCVHMTAYNTYKIGIEDDQEHLPTQELYRSISVEKIPYPFKDADDIDNFLGYASGKFGYPSQLIPAYDENMKYLQHSNSFSKVAEPEKKKAWLHLPHTSLECAIYSRAANGCSCRQYYDGRSDLILNLNNKHLYCYSWLFDILHNTRETRFPLHVAYRSAKFTHDMWAKTSCHNFQYHKSLIFRLKSVV